MSPPSAAKSQASSYCWVAGFLFTTLFLAVAGFFFTMVFSTGPHPYGTLRRAALRAEEKGFKYVALWLSTR
eukprot:12319967-Alexandrium_andersonii.AAC.1